jgi:hypothetical protein
MAKNIFRLKIFRSGRTQLGQRKKIAEYAPYSAVTSSSMDLPFVDLRSLTV